MIDKAENCVSCGKRALHGVIVGGTTDRLCMRCWNALRKSS